MHFCRLIGSAHQTLFVFFHIRAIFVLSVILFHDEFPERKASPQSFGTCTGEDSFSALKSISVPSIDNFVLRLGFSGQIFQNYAWQRALLVGLSDIQADPWCAGLMTKVSAEALWFAYAFRSYLAVAWGSHVTWCGSIYASIRAGNRLPSQPRPLYEGLRA